MLIEVNMPKAGAMMNKGTIVKWLKEIGDEVDKGEPIIEIEAEKTNMEIEALESGVLEKIIVQENEEANVGEVLGIIRGK